MLHIFLLDLQLSARRTQFTKDRWHKRYKFNFSLQKYLFFLCFYKYVTFMIFPINEIYNNTFVFIFDILIVCLRTTTRCDFQTVAYSHLCIEIKPTQLNFIQFVWLHGFNNGLELYLKMSTLFYILFFKKILSLKDVN